jgi:hypothetical protein
MGTRSVAVPFPIPYSPFPAPMGVLSSLRWGFSRISTAIASANHQRSAATVRGAPSGSRPGRSLETHQQGDRDAGTGHRRRIGQHPGRRRRADRPGAGTETGDCAAAAAARDRRHLQAVGPGPGGPGVGAEGTRHHPRHHVPHAADHRRAGDARRDLAARQARRRARCAMPITMRASCPASICCRRIRTTARPATASLSSSTIRASMRPMPISHSAITWSRTCRR